MNRAPSRAATGPRSGVVRTPLPPARGEDESRLTYKPSQKPWVKLAHDVNPEFPRTRSVQVYAVEGDPDTPTTYPNQDVPWARTDRDSWYRVRKRVKVIKRSAVEIYPFPHTKLYTSKIMPGKRAGYGNSGRYPINDPLPVYYLSERQEIEFNGKKYELPMNTGVTVGDKSSRLKKGETGTDYNINNMYYVIQVYFETEEWSYTHCRHRLRVSDLVPVNDAELVTLQKKKVPSWRLVSAERVPANDRGKEQSKNNDDTFWE